MSPACRPTTYSFISSTAADIEALIAEVAARVKAVHGIELRAEVHTVGASA